MSGTPKPVGRPSPYRQQRPSTAEARKAPRRSSLGLSLSSPRVPPRLSSPRPEPRAGEHAAVERESTGDNPRRGRPSFIPSPRPRTAPPRRSSFGSSAPPPSQPPPLADGAARRAPCAKRQPQPRPRQPTAAAAAPTQHAHRERAPQPSPRQSLPASKRTLPARPEAAATQPAAAAARRPADHEFDAQPLRKPPAAAAVGATAAAVQPGSSLPFFRFSVSAPTDAPAQSLSPPPAVRPPPVELMDSPLPLTPPAASLTPPAASLTPPPKAFSPAGMQRQGSSLEVRAPLPPPSPRTLHTPPPPAPPCLHCRKCARQPPPLLTPSTALPTPSCPDIVPFPSSDHASLEADNLYLGRNLCIQAATPCIQAATLRYQVDAFEFNSPKPFTHASHRAEWPRLADSARSAHSTAVLEENGAATPATPCARGCNLWYSGCNPMCTRLQPYVPRPRGGRRGPRGEQRAAAFRGG